VRTKKRDELMQHLKDKEIMAAIHYPMPVHMQPAYKNGQKLGVTEKIAKEILSLPMYPELSDSDVQKTIDAIKEFCK
jgi:dTDP-4-amino-4,6-dideoxygalactose transaminase